jgi:hypothetical protein
LWSIKILEQVDDISFKEQGVVFTKEDLAQGICIKVDFLFKKCRTNFCHLSFSFEWGNSRFFRG